MLGYDSLLDSHYDHYFIEYSNFSTRKIFPSSFIITNNISNCTILSGSPSSLHKTINSNPIKDFINNDFSRHESSFKDFKQKHNKKYATELEHQNRSYIFKKNLRFIDSVNRQGLSYKLAVNRLADRSDDEIYKGRLKQSNANSRHENIGESSIVSNVNSNFQLPKLFDWRTLGAVNPVKDQAYCGSCWSFGITGAIERAYFIKHKKLISLSEQNLIDCSWGFGNLGCDGGLDTSSYEWIIKHGGIVSEKSYGPYLAIDGYCHFNQTLIAAYLSGYVNVTPNNPIALKIALVNVGPIAVGVDASQNSFSFYANGVYYEPNCVSIAAELDHLVLLVGYGTIFGKNYWLIKNSWSSYWANNGYMMISQK